MPFESWINPSAPTEELPPVEVEYLFPDASRSAPLIVVVACTVSVLDTPSVPERLRFVALMVAGSVVVRLWLASVATREPIAS